jgi:hypothetical protein
MQNSVGRFSATRRFLRKWRNTVNVTVTWTCLSYCFCPGWKRKLMNLYSKQMGWYHLIAHLPRLWICRARASNVLRSTRPHWSPHLTPWDIVLRGTFKVKFSPQFRRKFCRYWGKEPQFSHLPSLQITCTVSWMSRIIFSTCVVYLAGDMPNLF